MTDLGWRADGIERAMAAGGIPLEIYRRPGFEAGKGVRRSEPGGPGSGFPLDPHWSEYADPDPEDKR